MAKRDHCAFGRWMLFMIIGVGALAVGLVLLSAPRPASAHSWYHHECCNDRDCRPLAAGAVRETPDGYLLVETGRIIPYSFGKFRVSRDERYHLCTTAGDPRGDILCFYRPPMSF